MANIWLCHVVALLFVISGIVQAESSIRQNDQELHPHHTAPFTDYERKDADGVWNAPLSLKPQRKKRMTSEDGDEAASAYLAALAAAGGDSREKRGRDSFRGDLGKRMQPSASRSVEKQAAAAALAPVFWVPDKRFKVISRFRGDLGKRGKSSFRGDLGKRQFPFAASDDIFEDDGREFETGDSYRPKFGDGQTEQMVDAMPYKDRGISP